MPFRAGEDPPLSARSSSKMRIDSERPSTRAGGAQARFGDAEKLWHYPFLSKTRKQRSGDAIRQQQRPENTNAEVVAGRRRKGPPLDEVHGQGNVASSSRSRIGSTQRSRPTTSKHLDRQAEKSRDAEFVTDHILRSAEEHAESSSDADENMQIEIDTSTRPHSKHLHTRSRLKLSNERKKIRELEKELDAAKKLAAERSDKIETLTKEISDLQENNRTQAAKLQQCVKSEETLAAVQSHLQCQICLELLTKPFALSPCGHVLCQVCLQSWFKDAPPQEGEQNPEGVLLHPLQKKKYCPCCRTRVVLRPIPVFVLKNLVGLFPREEESADDVGGDGDLWEGIFYEQKSAAELEDDEDDYESAASEEDEFGVAYDTEYQSDASSAEDRFMVNEEYFSGDEGVEVDSDEEEEGYQDLEVDSDIDAFALPEWSLPFYRDEVDQYRTISLTRTDFQLLQRGATLGMIDNYQMTINRDFGIVARTEEGTYVLGWNIAKPDASDPFGVKFMEWVRSDIVENPNLWYVVSGRGTPCFWRLQGGSAILGIDEEDEEDESD